LKGNIMNTGRTSRVTPVLNGNVTAGLLVHNFWNSYNNPCRSQWDN
jgi:hypothetical protein